MVYHSLTHYIYIRNFAQYINGFCAFSFYEKFKLKKYHFTLQLFYFDELFISKRAINIFLYIYSVIIIIKKITSYGKYRNNNT